MRYYYEPEKREKTQEMQKNMYEIRKQKKTHDSLVIEEDTVYEVDEVCMRYRNSGE